MFTKGQAVEFVERVFGNSTPSNQGLNASVVCPVCRDKKSSLATTYSKRKLVIRTDNFLCHCWVCGYKSRNLIELLKRYHPEWLAEYLKTFVGHQLLQSESSNDWHAEDSAPPSLTLPSDFSPLILGLLTNRLSDKEKDMCRYLQNRLGPDYVDDIEYWGLGHSEADAGLRDRIIIPSFDSVGALNYYTARSIAADAFPRYRNPQVPREDMIFNELNLDWTSQIILFEGPFDLLKSGQQNATCLLGSTLTTDFLLFARIIQHNTPVILALDRDAKEKEKAVAKLLHAYGVDVKMVDIPEPYNDVGEMPRNEFKVALEAARVYSSSNALLERIAGLTLGI